MTLRGLVALRALGPMLLVMPLAASGCVHGPQELERKAEFEDDADYRLRMMEATLVGLRHRASGQSGPAGAEQSAAVDRLEHAVAHARAELLAMEGSSADLWLEQRERVRAQLAAVDSAYEEAIGLMMAH
jgi:hypothetical protein